ncbi:hypothetical protein MPH_10096 [Macrophomina phaseolina MS6]|uniref:Uncharacterized protein n=1 Tax=Macrophomina phaseolina (strain MS6) TaxID=1126212 RepID=K2RE36_MACPH|nr:hypothetical protein MPH_10096 [Macrophomina phaseolina MS6]
MFGFRKAIHSPTGEPKLGPAFAEATKSPMGWAALSASANMSAMVPATLDNAVLPAAPHRNWKTISMGRFLASADPWRPQTRCQRRPVRSAWLGTHDVEDGVEQDGDHVDPFPAADVTVQAQHTQGPLFPTRLGFPAAYDKGPRKAGPTAVPTMNMDWPSVTTWVLPPNFSCMAASALTYEVEVRATKIWSRQ